MERLPTQIDPRSAEFVANAEANRALVATLRATREHARAGGGARALERHHAQGKLFVRDRLTRLLDPGSPFLELSPLAAHDVYEGEAPGAGLVTGIGRVSGREVLVVANDATVKGAGSHDKTGRHCLPHDPNGKLDIVHHAGYWLCDENGEPTKAMHHICWDGCMFPNATMMQQQT